ncbi:MAG: PEP-CTERM sorting domain-containing protein [Alphaproteobacteria bacterium]|jgi:hypothetical protein|nr:PEP-CTERM sorting domain-containing protein [Alphaproteobacteria bacterium]MBP9877508.1 PEP-CTERM sorting domain-containing protein [Alphaproteobacteria bacterium]
MLNKTMIAVSALTASLLYAGQALAVIYSFDFRSTGTGPDGIINPGSTTGFKVFHSVEDNSLGLTVRPSVEFEDININSNYIFNNADGFGMRAIGDVGSGAVLDYSMSNEEREMITLDLANLNAQVFSTYGVNITSYILYVSSANPLGVEASYSLGGGSEIGLFPNVLTPFSGNSLLRVFSPYNGEGNIRITSLTFTFEPVSATPEPGIVALLGFSLAGLALLRYRK